MSENPELPKRPISKAKRLRDLMAEGVPIVTPGAYDALSARLIVGLGFNSLALGGSTMLASRFGLPDLGLAGFAEMLELVRDVAGSVEAPCMADADDGYGDIKSVVRTVRAYEGVGIAGIVLEDQERAVKRPGDSAAQGVSPVEVMAAKLKAAVAHRTDPDTVIMARSDSYAIEGMGGVLRRCEAYLKAGADGLYVPGLSSHEDLALFGSAFPGVHKMLVQAEGGKTPWLSPGELHRMGYAQIVYPSYVLNRAILAITSACDELGRAAASQSAPAILADLHRARESFDAAVELAAWRRIEEAEPAQHGHRL